MSEIEKLIALIEDGHLIKSIQTMEDLEAYFANSRTGIADLIEGGLTGLLSQAEGDGASLVRDLRDYLLWDYIAQNIANLRQDYELVRDLIEEKTARDEEEE